MILLIVITLILGGLTLFPTGVLPFMLNVGALVTAAAAGFILWLSRSRPNRIELAIAPPLALILVFLLATILPFPLNASRYGGQLRYEQNTAVAYAASAARELNLTDYRPQGFSLARNRPGALRVTLLVAGMASMLLLAQRLSQQHRRTALRLLTILGAGLGAAGIASRYLVLQGDTVWWIFPVAPAQPGPLTCFRNQNHFAAFMAILLPGALLWLVSDLRERRWPWAVLAAGCSLLILLGTAISNSRGGLVTLGVAYLATTCLLFICRRPKAAGIMAILAVLIAIAAPVLLPAGYRSRLHDLRDFRNDDSYRTRLTAWHDSINIVRAYPILGAGANGYRTVYPQHRSHSDGAVQTHAENEYVQLAVDGGLLGTLAALWLILMLARQAWWPALRRRQPDTAVLAALAATVAATVNAAYDFALHIPLYGFTLATLIGLGLPDAPIADNARTAVPFKRALRLAVPLLACLAVAVITVGFYAQQTWDSVRRRDITRALKALNTVPTSAWDWYYLGRRIEEAQVPGGLGLAHWCMQTAVNYDPQNYRLWYNYGLSLMRADDRPAAKSAFDRAGELRGWGWGGEGLEVAPETR